MAGRIRSIKPEILDDEKTAALSHLAWRLFVSLWLIADDHGNLRGDAGYIQGQALWATGETRDTVAAALDELRGAGLIARYTVRGQSYFTIPGWQKHQKVDKPGRPRMPGPAEADPTPYREVALLAEPSRNPRESLEPDLRPPTSDPDHEDSLPAHAIPPSPEPAPVPTPAAPPAPDREMDKIVQSGPRGEAPMLWRELEAARLDVGAKLGLEILPLPIGDRGERDLADLFAATRKRGPEAVETLVRQVRHAIAMAAAETVAGESKPEWFTGAVFSPDNFRRLVAKQPAKRADPKPPRRPNPGPPAIVSTLTVEERLALAAESRATLGIADGARAPPSSARPATDENEQPQPRTAT